MSISVGFQSESEGARCLLCVFVCVHDYGGGHLAYPQVLSYWKVILDHEGVVKGRGILLKDAYG
jgi:hypothetical protein